MEITNFKEFIRTWSADNSDIERELREKQTGELLELLNTALVETTHDSTTIVEAVNGIKAAVNIMNAINSKCDGEYFDIANSLFTQSCIWNVNELLDDIFDTNTKEFYRRLRQLSQHKICL